MVNNKPPSEVEATCVQLPFVQVTLIIALLIFVLSISGVRRLV